MTDSIIWAKPNTAVNLDAISYIEFDEAMGAKMVFSTGTMIALEPKDAERLARYLRKKFTEDVRLATSQP